ncbi:hypothetical protein Btru_046739 [Bulinus truncatus]|nr:hypothetical protein Btru_046739 [Bulinus truncatus]
MKPRTGSESTSDRAGSNREPYPDFSKPTRAISPAFRPGPRLKRHDQNADEIIRFVREFQQRQDPSHKGPAAIKKRSVLPAIGLHDNGKAVIRPAVRPAGNMFGNSVNDSGYADRSSETVTQPADDFKNNEVGDLDYSDNMATPSLDLSLLQDKLARFHDVHPINRQLIGVDAEILASGTRVLKSLDVNKGNNNTTTAISTNINHHVVLTRFSNGSSKTAQLVRPRALPQLPPIDRDDLPDRPSAPSPSATPTSPVLSTATSFVQNVVMSQQIFRTVDGTLFCEDLNLQEILEVCKTKFKVSPTPLFVYSKSQIINNIQAYQNALKLLECENQLNYAVKANPNLTLLKLIRSQGASATLISGNEIKLALEAGFEPTTMMYNGGGKCPWETHLAIQHNLLINVDSLWDLKQTMDICKNGFSEPKTARVLLRLNLNIDPAVHKFINTGKADSKFGLSEEEAEACLSLLEQPDCSAELVGLHSHLGSTIYQSEVFRSSLQRLLEYHSKLISRGFTKAHLINIGGGLGIDYKQLETKTRAWQNESDENKKNILALQDFLLTIKDCDTVATDSRNKLLSSISEYRNESISFEDLREATNLATHYCKELVSYVEELCPILITSDPAHATPLDLIQSVSDLLRDKNIKLIIEPGRSIVANGCVVISRILGCKQSSEKRFIVVDVSMTEIIRPCLYGAYHHVTVLDNSPSNSTKGEKKVYNVVGPVCESSDFLAQNRLLPENPDGYVVVHDVGAYCYSMASNYNIRLRPAEVLVDGIDCILIRRPDTFEDFMAPYREI